MATGDALEAASSPSGPNGAAMPEQSSALESVRAIAISFWKNGDLRSAIKSLEIFLTENTGDCYTWSDLGVLYYSCGRYARAEKSFDRALRFDPEFTAALRGRAEAL